MGNCIIKNKVADISPNESATRIQSFWRGHSYRKEITIKQLTEKQMKYCRAYLVGNDPQITGLAPYASKPGETIALIGTSGFRSLALACELGHKESIPKLIIVDNSYQVITFWRSLRKMVEKKTFADPKKFTQAFRKFLYQNEDLYRIMADDYFSSRHNSPHYENQNTELYLNHLIDSFGLDYLCKIIKKATFIAQSWTDKTLFKALKNILALHNIDKIYLYPSNILHCIEHTNAKVKADDLLANIQQIAPTLSIITDVCPTHGLPKQVFLTAETEPKQIRNLLFSKRTHPDITPHMAIENGVIIVRSHVPLSTKDREQILGKRNQEPNNRLSIRPT